MDTAVELQSAILDPELRHTNFFNGRLLSGEDLSTERDANHAHSRLQGQAIGPGVAYGLEVSRAQGSPPSDVEVEIKAGLAVNKAGRVLRLACDQTISLVRPPDAGKKADCVFSDCAPLAAGTTLGADGHYLLTIAPASEREGLAPVSGLGNSPAACNSRYFTEGVQFRLLPLNVAKPSDAAHERNEVAYQCFGSPAAGMLILNDALAAKCSKPYGIGSLVSGSLLTPNDVPLCLIGWQQSVGVGFFDQWSVRRQVVAPVSAGPWSYFADDLRRCEGAAMFLQFQDHILELSAANPNAIAENYFRFLPPLGLLPVAGTGSPQGFTASAFFGAHASQDVALLNGAELRSLITESFQHEPMRLGSIGKLQLYLMWESVRAVETGAGSQLIMVFAAPALSYRGTARFGYAKWNLSRHAFSVV